MSGKSKLSLVSSCSFIFLLLLCFNNCAPLGSPIGEGEQIFSSSGSAAAKQFFQNTVTPAFNGVGGGTSCASCHAAGGSATARIYEYGFSKNYMLSGAVTSIDNQMQKKLNGGITHVGGVLCASDIVSPCKELKAWAVMEKPMLATVPVGMITNVSPTGLVTGWAMNPQSPATPISVSIASDTAIASGGTVIATATATGLGAAPYSGHYFSVQLPPAVVDSTSRNLYAYAGGTAPTDLFLNSPFLYRAYGPTADGLSYYNNTLTGATNRLAACISCHNGGAAFNFTYQNTWDLLATPGPITTGGVRPGTATTNIFIKRALGIGHAASLCNGNVAVEPCASIVQWWNVEFGP